MEVILLKDIDLGDRGNVIRVAEGHARNFLIPNRLAVPATPKNKKHFQQIAQQQQRKLDKEKAAVEMFAKKINEYPEIIIKAKGSEAGVLYGAVTGVQLAEVLKQAHGVEFDKKRIMIKQIREPGITEVPVRLTFGITAKAKIKIEIEIEKTKEKEPSEKKTKGRKKKETEPTENAETEKSEVEPETPKKTKKEKVAKEAKA